MARVRAGAAPGGRPKKVKVVVTGHRKIDRKLRGLEPKVAKKVIRQSFRRNMKPVLTEAKALSPVDTGAMRKAMKLRAGKRSRKYAARMLITIRPEDIDRDVYLLADEAPYPVYPEFGTEYQEAQEPLRRAANQSRKPFRRAVAKDILRGIEAEARKG